LVIWQFYVDTFGISEIFMESKKAELTYSFQQESLRKEVAEGLLFTHARLSENTKLSLEAASFLYGLIEILTEKEILTLEEIDERQLQVAERLVKKNRERGIGILLQEPEHDKYNFNSTSEIDCESRVSLCKEACCRLPFALSKQDIREGVVHWDLGQPYIIAQEKDGYCSHLIGKSRQCSIRQHRPVPCRAYDCSKDQKIWLNFEERIINPEVLKDDWPRNATKDNDEAEFK
jgi:Fe-S-cluster containining protein